MNNRYKFIKTAIGIINYFSAATISKKDSSIELMTLEQNF